MYNRKCINKSVKYCMCITKLKDKCQALISMVKDESDLLLFVVLFRCGVVQFLRHAVSIFSFLLGEGRTDKAGTSVAGTVRGF